MPVAIRIPYSASSTDVSAQVLQLKEKQPDVVIFISYTADAILYMKTMKNLDYMPPMVIGDDSGFSDPSFIPAVERHRAGRHEPQRLGDRQAGLGHLQDQRNVQGEDRPRSRRHHGAQYAELLRARRRHQPRRLDRSGEDPRRADQDRSQARPADDGLSGRQVRQDRAEHSGRDLSDPAAGQEISNWSGRKTPQQRRCDGRELAMARMASA